MAGLLKTAIVGFLTLGFAKAFSTSFVSSRKVVLPTLRKTSALTTATMVLPGAEAAAESVATAASSSTLLGVALPGGIPAMSLLGGLEAGLALFAGHIPGVVVGLFTLVWGALLKAKVAEALPDAYPVLSLAAGTPANLWMMIMLGVRLATLLPDQRYSDFPSDVAAPIGCTRVASDFTNNAKGLSVPTFKASVDEVQDTIKSWIQSQPRSTILSEKEGYIHAQILTNLIGFPDNLGVKVFKNSSGKTEVWLQGELRVGQGDLGVNNKRISTLLQYLEENEKKLN